MSSSNFFKLTSNLYKIYDKCLEIGGTSTTVQENKVLWC
jgi:hypothetical protein